LEFLSFWNFEYATILGKGKFFLAEEKWGNFYLNFFERFLGVEGWDGKEELF
jgi:hypothetical protein